MIYVANIRMPTEKAHGAQIVKTIEGLAQAGEKVTLMVPKRRTHITESPFTYYGVPETFTIEYVPVRDTVSWGILGFLFETFSFAFACAGRIARDELVYSRDEWVLTILSWRGIRKIVWESHTGAWNIAARFVAKRTAALIVISQGLKEWYIQKGVPDHKVLVAHDGVDISDFANAESKESARTRLKLPLGAKVAMYVGRLDGWKGTETLYKAAALLKDILVVVIGGEEEQIARARQAYPSIRFLGTRPYLELTDNLAAADVLVLPNTGTDKVSVSFTSPLKLFAYMASGKPIVASDLPSIREVLDDTNAYLIKPDDAQALATSIKAALHDDTHKGDHAKEKANRYDWHKRADAILAFVYARQAAY